MNRIDQLLQQMIAETSQQVLPTVYSATMLAGLQELQGLTRSIAEQRAFAQQPATAVPDAMDETHAGSSCESSYRHGWNACRAAMLATKEGQSHE